MRVVRDGEARELTEQNEEKTISKVVANSNEELNLNSAELLIHTC